MIPTLPGTPHRMTTARAFAVVLVTLGASPLAGQSPIAWSPCPGSETDTVITECAVVEMPLDHARPSGETMTIGVRRVLGSRSDGRQLWLLPGGPGDPVGDALGSVARILGDPGLDLYGIDHRGTGASGHLACPAQQAVDSPDGTEITAGEWGDCIAYLEETREDLEFLTVTQSSMDLGRFIDRLRPEGGSVFVLGISYGTFWANRYLQLFPDQPTGVILDGIVPADWSFAEFDSGLDAAGRRWLAECAKDVECGARLGDDPAASLAATLGRLEDGHCPALGLDAATARLILGVVLMVDGLPNALIPALAYRLERCAWHDQTAVLNLFRVILETVGEPETHSPALQRHIALSELWDASDPDSSALEAALSRTVVTTGVSASFAKTFAPWPRYPADPLDGQQAEYEGPLMMLHGGLDPTMPVERLAGLRSHFDGEAQTFTMIPEAGHVVINFSECARAMYAVFLADPNAALDTSCVGAERFIGFAVEPAVVEALLGASDLWGDNVSGGETFWFYARYRWAVLLLGVAVPIAWFLAVRRGRPAVSLPTNVSRRRLALGLVGWTLVTLVAYTLTASIPLLMDYRDLTATLAAGGVVLVQAVAGGGLGRWSRGPAAS